MLQHAGYQTVVPDYPGHGRLYGEKLQSDLRTIARFCITRYRDDMQPPYRFYGHSMGALVAYLCTLELQEQGQPLPEKLVVSGRPAPNRTVRPESTPHLLEKSLLIDFLNNLGGVSKEMLEEAGFFDYYEPIIRADLEAVHTYRCDDVRPVDVPLAAMMGSKERFSTEACREWKWFSHRAFDMQILEGGHFFIEQHRKKVLETILS